MKTFTSNISLDITDTYACWQLWCDFYLNDLSSFAFIISISAEFGEELADERLVHRRVSRQLPAVGVVGLVRMFANLWARG